MATNPNRAKNVVNGDATVLEKMPDSLEGVETGVGDVDDSRLAEMGYKAELNRNFTLLSCLAVGFNPGGSSMLLGLNLRDATVEMLICATHTQIANTWLAVTGALSTGIPNGGSVVYVYGTILVALVHVAIGASLGELASAYPNAEYRRRAIFLGYFPGAEELPEVFRKYFWVWPSRESKVSASYLTGVVAWAGAMITGASVSLMTGQIAVELIILAKPEVVYQPWMGFVSYQIANISIFVINYFEKILPMLSTGSLYFSLMSFVVITITVLVVSPTKRGSQEIWATFTNDSGWSNDGVGLITGLLGVNWGFSCLNACTHMAEEIPNPERNVPKAIMGIVGIGFVTSWVYIIAIFYSLQDIQAVASAIEGVALPINRVATPIEGVALPIEGAAQPIEGVEPPFEGVERTL
ncbi:hypothetical protein RUND412_004413 [Rhizina undulata]